MLISRCMPYLGGAPPAAPQTPAPAAPAPPQDQVSVGKRVAAAAGGAVGAAATSLASGSILGFGGYLATGAALLMIPLHLIAPGASFINTLAGSVAFGSLAVMGATVHTAVTGGAAAYRAASGTALKATSVDRAAQGLRDGSSAVADAKTCRQALAAGYRAGSAVGAMAGTTTGHWVGVAQGFLGGAALTASVGGAGLPALLVGIAGGALGYKVGGFVGKYLGQVLAGSGGAVVGSAGYGLKKL